MQTKPSTNQVAWSSFRAGRPAAHASGKKVKRQIFHGPPAARLRTQTYRLRSSDCLPFGSVHVAEKEAVT